MIIHKKCTNILIRKPALPKISATKSIDNCTTMYTLKKDQKLDISFGMNLFFSLNNPVSEQPEITIITINGNNR